MWSVTVFLCGVWALSILYGEMFAFWLPSLSTCSSWPHHLPKSSPMNGVEYPGAYVKVAVIADPQLMDKTSHNFGPMSLILEIVQFYTDLFMRRVFLASVSPVKPDVILFLGDYFDGGTFLSDEEWQESLSRLRHIFELNSFERSMNAQVYHLPGNHDIGYAAFHRHMPQVIRRYEKVFGRRNYQFTLGEVDFIAIDAQTVDGHPQGNLTSETWTFIKNVAWGDSSLRPRVLLTHIPLYRPDWTSCGPHRSSPVINQRVSRAASDGEILYQNYISEEATNKLLESVRPVLILSGHDHDQCTVTHMTTYGPVREHTVGTISWQQGNIYPSYMLLSASNHTINVSSHDDAAVVTQLCFLPVQLFIYLWYLFLFVMTLLLALLWPTIGLGFSRQVGDFMGYIRSIISSSIFSGGIKEKNEDDNCEYEMVWDAEGSMHLIKKALKDPTTASSEKGTVERGNVVMRSTAKKQILQEIDVSIPLDVNISVGSDTVSKLGPPRANKSKTKIAIRRVVRLLRVLTIVAAVNLPLYMMLLFKDWIDK